MVPVLFYQKLLSSLREIPQALFSSLLLTLSFPPFNLHFLVWFALVPLLLTIKDKSLKITLCLSYLTGIVYFMGVFFWINTVKGVTLLHFSVMGIYLGLYFLLFGFFLHLIYNRGRFPFIISVPVLWVGVEFLRSHVGDFALPLALLGHTQQHNLPLLQMASFTGAHGVSFVIVIANAVIADLVAYWIEQRGNGKPFCSKNPYFLRVTAVFVMLLILWIGGYLSLSSAPSGKRCSVAIAQGNIQPELKWNREYRDQILSKYENLSEEVLKKNPQLIVWPEASTPGFVLKDKGLYQRMTNIVQQLNTHLLVGSAEYPKFSKTLMKAMKSGNTALFFSPDGKVIGQYIKIRLVPFGEHVPYEGIIPWPKFIASPSTNSHIAGTELILFEMDGTKLGTLICSEMMYPELSRGMVKKGADFLVNISNEGWFGKSSFPYQFLSVCVFRAIENRVNIVRCTNTGISCFIDPYGRITSRLAKDGKDIFIEGTLTREILLSPPGSFYTRHGDLFAYACIFFTIALVIWSLFRGRIEPPPVK